MLENCTGGDEVIGSCVGARWSRFGIDPTVYFHVGTQAGSVDKAAHPAHFLNGTLDEFLAGETWVNGHQQNNVNKGE